MPLAGLFDVDGVGYRKMRAHMNLLKECRRHCHA